MRTGRELSCLLVSAALTGAACSDDVTKPAPITAVAMAPSGSSSFSGTVGTAVSPIPAVVVTGSSGQPFAGASVTFTVTGGGGSVTAATATTNASGIATAGGWTLGTTAGVNTLRATSGTLEAVTFTATGTPAAPATLTVVSGNAQTTVVGTAVPNALAVRVADQYGNAVPSTSVTFQVTGGDGQIVGGSAMTNAQGEASPGAWILGGVIGEHTVTAVVANLTPVTFTATGTVAAVARILASSGGGQTGEVNTALANPLTAVVTDAFGNPVPDVTVNFAITAGSGTLTPATATSDAQGMATTNLTLNAVGHAVVTATSPSITGGIAIFTANGTAAPPATITVVSGDAQTTTVGTPVPDALVVRVADQRGNPVPDATVTFQVSSGGGQILAGSAKTNAEGRASAGGWILGGAIGPQTVTAAVGSLTPVTFTATGTGAPAARIVVSAGSGQSGNVKTALANPLAALVTDAFGNPVPNIVVNFAVTAGSGTLAPEAATSNEQGIATTSLTLTAVGQTVVTATCSSVTGGSAVFTVTGTVAAPAAITVISGNAQTAIVGTAVPNALVVRVADQYDNAVPNAAVTFQVTAGGGQIIGGSATTDAQGQASAGGWILGGSIGSQTLTATVDGVTPVTFTATGTVAAAARILVSAGSGQTGDINTPLPNPLATLVTDAFGNPVANTTVNFAVTGGSGTLTPAAATSNAQGIATASLTLTAAGQAVVTATSASVTGGSAVFKASTGPSVVGQITQASSPPWPFSGAAGAFAASAARVTSGKLMGAMNAAGVGGPSGQLRTGEQPARLIDTRGMMVVSYKPDAFGLPVAATAYRSTAMRQQAVEAYAGAIAPFVQANRLVQLAISPAIGAVRVDVAAGENQDAIVAELRRDPRVLAVEQEVVYYTLENARIAAPAPLTRLRSSFYPALFLPPATERYPMEPLAALQLWHYGMIDAFRAWVRTTGATSSRVAIIDTGVRADHPALAGRVSMTESYDFTDGVTNAFGAPQLLCGGGGTFTAVRGTAAELTLPRNAPQDPLQVWWNGTCWQRDTSGSHGTHVAGTIASQGNDGVGGTGIAWNATLIAVRALGVTGAGLSFDVAQAILYAGGLPATYTGAPTGFTVTMPAADVVNMSLSGGPNTVVQNAITAASANTLIIAGAGNNASSIPVYPAGYAEPLAIVALDPTWQLASYTNIGAHVDLAAPGGDFRLGGSAGVFSATFNYSTMSPNYTFYQGTSTAAPHVTGVAALIKAANPSFTPTQVRNRLIATAVDLGPTGRDNRFGHGVVNAFRAVTGGPPAAVTRVHAINANGGIVKNATVGAGGGFTFANLAPGSYMLVAGQDEANDGLQGIPGRRFGWFGSAGPLPFDMSETTVKNVAFNVGAPLEAEPNDVLGNAQQLVVNSWVAGHVGGTTDVADLYRILIPTAGTYTFETSGFVGACGFASEVDTVLRLLNSAGTELASDDDTSFPAASYPGQYCSVVTATLSPGTYFVSVTPYQTQIGTYRLHVRSGT